MTAKRVAAVICQKRQMTEDIFSMWLQVGDMAKMAKPGQFVILYCKDKMKQLGRPISICEIDGAGGKIRLVFRVTGKGTGTEEFSGMNDSDRILCMGPLGNGYTFTGEGKALLMGGGIGIPPLLELAKQLPGDKTIVLGYRDARTFLAEDFRKYGSVIIATEDGSIGTKGNVLDAIRAHGIEGNVIYGCGPKPMLRAISQFAGENHMEAWLSLEERMACGIGICLGCAVAIKTETGMTFKRVCHDGPVFNSKEIVFDE